MIHAFKHAKHVYSILHSHGQSHLPHFSASGFDAVPIVHEASIKHFCACKRKVFSSSVIPSFSDKHRDDADGKLSEKFGTLNKVLIQRLCTKTALSGEAKYWLAHPFAGTCSHKFVRVKKKEVLLLRFGACSHELVRVKTKEVLLLRFGTWSQQ